MGMNNEIIGIVKKLCKEDTVPEDFFCDMGRACGYAVVDDAVFIPEGNGKRKYITPRDLVNDIGDGLNDRSFLTQYFLNTKGEMNRLPKELRTAILDSPEYMELTKDNTQDAISGAVMELWEHPKENGVIFMEGINADGTHAKQYFDAEQFEKGIKPQNTIENEK
jgi:hypothetical protein